MRRFAAAAFAALLLLATGRASAIVQDDPPPTPEDQYWNIIYNNLGSAGQKNDANQELVRLGLDQRALTLESIKQIELSDHTIIPVDNSGLVEVLRRNPIDYDAIGVRFDTLYRARANWVDLGQTGNGTRSPMDVLKAVMAQPQFQWPETEQRPNPIQEWLDDLGRRIQEWLLSLIPDELQVYLDLNSLFSIIGGLVLLVIIFFVLRGVLLNIVEDTELNPDDDALGEVITAEGALQRARDVSETGDYRTAVRFLYLSTLLFLEEHGMLRYDRSRTNREYLGSIRHKPELAAIFRDVVEVFDRVWYGYHSLDKDSFDHYVARVAEIRRQR